MPCFSRHSACVLLVSSATVLAAHAGDAPEFAPLVAVGGSQMGVQGLALDPVEYGRLRGHDAVRLVGMAAADGQGMVLDLTRLEVFAEDAVIIAADEHGERPLARPDVQMFTGTVSDRPDSRVFLAISPLGTSGYIDVAGQRSVISSGEGGQKPTVIYDAAGPAARLINLSIPVCAGAVPTPESLNPPGYTERGQTCRTLRLAVDCDTEFTASLFGGSQAAATAYVTTLIGAMTEIYREDVTVGFDVGYLRLWTGTDPYTASDNGAQLPQFRSYWNSNMGGVPRQLAHLLSGRGLGGGIAYLSAACTSNGYAVSANLNGYFPYPIQDHSAQNWDIMVVAHETGHNLGTLHTHDGYSPPIDGCGNAYMNPPGVQDCSQAWMGTIMSYCHICPGGMSNINLTFGERVSGVIRGWIDGQGSCGITGAAAITDHPDTTSACPGDPAAFSVTATGGGAKTYRWRRNTVTVAGATAATYSIASVTPAHAGSYDCVVSSACGAETSTAAALTVLVCACDPDLNHDGNTDQDDVAYIINVVGGGGNPAGIDPDFNGDGNVDQDDVAAVINVVAGGPCP